MIVLWLIEDSNNQRERLQSLLTKMGYTVHAFENIVEVLGRIADLPAPAAVVVDLALKGTSNGFQAAETIRKMRPEIPTGRFCFISGWKKQFAPMRPPEFSEPEIIDKGNWQLEQLQKELDRAINS